MSCIKLYVDDFGANTVPGTTDMTSAFQAAAEALTSGGVIKFIPGQAYKFTDTTTIAADNVTIDRTGATIDATELDLSLVSNRPDPFVHVLGSQRLATTLAADAAAEATTITVADATGVQVGDPIWIESDGELWYTEGANAIKRQVHNRVKAVTGLTISLTWPLPFSFDATSHTPVVHFWNCVKNFKMLGGRSYGGGARNDPDNAGTYVINGVGAADCFLEYVDGAHIDVDYIEGFQGFAIRPDKTMDVHVKGGTIRGHTDDYVDPVTSSTEVVEGRNSGFYGVFFNDSYGGSFRDCTGHRTRHMQDAGSTGNVLVENLHAYRNHRPPFGSHGGAVDFNFSDCYCTDGSGGIEWRGHNMKVEGCTLRNREGDGASIYDTAGSANDIPRNYSLTGNTFSGDRQGLLVRSNVKSLKSTGNDYLSKTSNFYPVDISTLDLDTATFSNDLMDGGGVAEYCLYAQNTTPRTRSSITVDKSRLTGYATGPARFFDTEVIHYTRNTVDAGDAITHDSTNIVDTEANYGIGGETA